MAKSTPPWRLRDSRKSFKGHEIGKRFGSPSSRRRHRVPNRIGAFWTFYFIAADIGTISGAADKALRVAGSPDWLLAIDFQSTHGPRLWWAKSHIRSTVRMPSKSRQR